MLRFQVPNDQADVLWRSVATKSALRIGLPGGGSAVERFVRLPGAVVQIAVHRGENAAPMIFTVQQVRGRPGAVFELAQRWVSRFGVWLDDAPHVAVATSANADRTPAEERGWADAESALQAAVAQCMRFLLPHACAIASGNPDPEHVHQLRVGLRRLRCAHDWFAGIAVPLDETTMQTLQALFSALGRSRDRDVMTTELLPALQSAGAPWLQLAVAAPALNPVDMLREPATTQAWLALLARLQPGPAHGARRSPDIDVAAAVQAATRDALCDQLGQRLRGWHVQVRRDAKRFDRLDETARHRLRKRIKRLRYILQFAGTPVSQKPRDRLLDALAPAQEILGRYNDACIALALYRHHTASDPRAWFAVGWLTAHRQNLLDEAARKLRRFRELRPNW
jgi:CHAD domain-containing protein